MVEIDDDISQRHVDAVVNAWNRNWVPAWLLVPEGVSRAIRLAGGRRALREISRRGPLPLGSAVETTAGELHARWVVHAAGIDLSWRASPGSVRAATQSALALARWLGARSVALPLIGAGAGGVRPAAVRRIMLEELELCRDHFDRLELVCPLESGPGARRARDPHFASAVPRFYASGAVPSAPGRTSLRRRVAFLGAPLALVAAAIACGPRRGAHSAASVDESSDRVAENVLRRDYAGSRSCRPCHQKLYSEWQASPMHRMTREITRTTIHAPFNGQVFHFMGDTARMETHHGSRYMLLDSKHEGHRVYRITKVIGGRYREDFVGIEVAGTGRYSGEVQSNERVLPVSWLVFDRSWRYKGYSVMTPERHGLRQGAVWRKTCIFCHNTEPYLDSTLDELYGPHSPAYQGSASIALPRSRRFRFEITDEGGLRDALSDELGFLGAPRYRGSDSPRAWLSASMRQIRRRFDARKLVEIGIGCEDCHGGSRQHVVDPLHVKPSFAVRSDFMRVVAPDGGAPTHAQNINRACERCHTVLFSSYSFTWEGGHRYAQPGGSGITSGEARDFLLGGCSTQMSCASCHDPHTRDPRPKLAALAGPAGTRLCTSCHEKLRGAAAISAHTHHRPDSAGSQCINCHMPKKNMGLDYALTRYHRIGSPTDRDRVERDRPLECALCHSDRSVESLVSTMERWWHKRYDRAALHRLYGRDLDQNTIIATLQRGKPHEQAAALMVAGRDHLVSALPLMVDQLDNRYPLVRYYARASIQNLTGEKLPLDMSAPGTTLLSEGRAWLRAHSANALAQRRPSTTTGQPTAVR